MQTLTLNGVVYSPQDLLAFIQIEREQTTLPVWKRAIYNFLRDWYAPTTIIEMLTSGSTGKPKQIHVKKSHMVNSATATLQALGIHQQGKALLILPATYIAGKMMIVRAIVGGLDLITAPPHLQWSAMNIPYQAYLLVAVVPAQLTDLMQADDKTFLDNITHLLVGGSMLSTDLEQWLSQSKPAIYITYGMTETVSHVALCRVNTTHYHALPDIEFNQGDDGHLIIKAPALCDTVLHTRDLVQLINKKTFIWLARLDLAINSGGLKIHPEQVEAKLSAIMQPLQQRYLIVGLPDDKLGEIVTLVIEGHLNAMMKEKLLTKCRQVCRVYEAPRQIKTIKRFIMTNSGKLNRMQILSTIKT